MAGDSSFSSICAAPAARVRSLVTTFMAVRWLGSCTPAWLVIRPVCARYRRLALWSNSSTLREVSFWSVCLSSSRRTRLPPTVSKVALTTSVVMVTCSVATRGALGTAAGAAAVPAAVGAGTPAAPGAAGWAEGTTAGAGGCPVAGVGGAEATGLGAGAPKMDGWPVCLFQASHSRTSDIVKTTHSRVRRISVMERVPEQTTEKIRKTWRRAEAAPWTH